MEDNLHDCLALCGLTNPQITAIETEGFLTLSDFGNLRYTDVSEFTKKLSGLDDADGGVYFGQAVVIKLRALVYWLNDCDRRGQEPDVNAFDLNELKRMVLLQRIEADNPTTEKGDTTVKAPDKFHPESMRGWSIFKRQLENYLQNLLGVRKVPLAYVIRMDPPPDDLPDDPMTELIYQVPLEGDTYEMDNRKVYRIILDAVADTEAYAWIKEIRNQDGRGAMLKLRAHFDGKGPKSKRVILAEKKLEQLHYKNEMTFKFEKYCSIMKDCFDTIEEDYRHVPGKERVDTLLAKINCSQLDAAVTYISMDDGLSADFEAAVNTLATRVAKVFPSAELKGQKRNISEVNSQSNNGGRGRGRFQRGGRAGRGGGRFNNTNNLGTNINGVDVTDPTRQFTSDEWAKIRQANAVNYLRNLRRQRNGRQGRGRFFTGGRGQAQQGGGGTRNNSEVNVSSVSNVEPGSATTAIMDDTTTIINNDRGGQNGSNFGPASYNNGGRNVRFASQVTTSTRRAVHLTTTNGKNESKHRNNMPAPNTTGRCEIDNHADTCCLGQNFLPLYFTGKVCEVSGYLDTLPTQTGVEICSAITAVDFQDGETILLVINEGLWYGDRMEHSLLNPNQIRAYGNMICDDPTDPHRALEITLVNENLIIPLTMRGTICGFMSRVPTEEEVRTLPRYALTSDTEWDPKEVRFKDSEDQDDWANVSALMTVSDVFIDSEFIKRLVSEVKVSTYPKLNTKATESRHRKPNISAEELARLWNIGLETAKQTLRVTTQAGIRYASQPLTRRYRTERPAMHHRRLFDVFYTDTLFSNIKSLRGARCAQIICNDKFIKIYPNQSKKMAPSEGLQAFIDDIGIPSEMVFDGLKEQIGHGTDFQKLLRTYKVKWNIIEPYTGKQNRAEPQIANLRRRWKLKMQQKGVPARLWDYGIVWEADTMNLTSRGTDLDRRTGYELVTGITPDISERLDFDFYDLCWYWDQGLFSQMFD